jgi:serine/threonine protein kinase
MSSNSDPIIGKQLGDYLIVDMLGQGGMARVYRGLDKKLNRYAAVKVIDATTIREDEVEYRKRFTNEARSIARLSHPNIVGVYQFDQVGNLYYMAMNFIEGRDLRSILKEHEKRNTYMSAWEVLRIIADMGSALDYAHSEGVIHRDVKPSNIMVTPGGKAVLTDFGLALSVMEGTIGNTFGSAHYIAPEQAVNSAQAVPQSDLYSLGVVLYEMLTNKVPFDDPSAMAVAMKHLTDPPPLASKINSHLPTAVDALLAKALEKEPKKRYENCQKLLGALEVVLGEMLRDVESGIPRRDFNSQSSRPSAMQIPGFNSPAASSKDSDSVSTRIVTPLSKSRPLILPQKPVKPQRPVWVWLVLGVLGVIFIMSALALLAGQNDSVARGNATTTAAVALLQTETITNALLPTATLEPTVQPSNTPTPVPASPTPEPVLPTVTEAVEAITTATEIPTIEATRTAPATATTAATRLQDSATAQPTATVTEVTTISTPLPNPAIADAPVVLRYDDEVLTVYIQAGTFVNVDNLLFVQVDGNGQEIGYESSEWEIGGRTTGLREGDCLQVLRNDRLLSLANTRPDYCRFIQSWRQISPNRTFWISASEAATFEVRRGNVILAVCRIEDGECALPVEELG